jgi:hypothetical protein
MKKKTTKSKKQPMKLKVPFKVSGVAASKKSASKGYWDATKKEVKKPSYKAAEKKFLEATKSKKTTIKPKKQPKLYLVFFPNPSDGKLETIYLDAHSIKKLGLLKNPCAIFIDGKIIDPSQIK